jgi:hypothetical protein
MPINIARVVRRIPPAGNTESCQRTFRHALSFRALTERPVECRRRSSRLAHERPLPSRKCDRETETYGSAAKLIAVNAPQLPSGMGARRRLQSRDKCSRCRQQWSIVNVRLQSACRRLPARKRGRQADHNEICGHLDARVFGHQRALRRRVRGSRYRDCIWRECKM